MPGSILGNRVVRKEDPKFLTTGGMYLDDLHDVPELAGAAHVAYVRSSVAHGTITSIDIAEATGDARASSAIYTAADLGLRAGPRRRSTPASPAPCWPATACATSASRSPPSSPRRAPRRPTPPRPCIVDYDLLEVVVDPSRRSPATTLLYDDAGSNAVFDSTALGMPDLTGDEYFADCEVTVTGTFVNQRVAPCPLEVRASAAAWVDGRLTQWVSTQHAQGVKDPIVAANGVEPSQVRVITPDVGGGFGAKIGTYPEEMVLGRGRPSSSAGPCAGRRPAASR